MPFSKDIRTGFCDIKLNSAWIHTEIIDMGYTELESTAWDKYFEAYMIVLEKDFDYYLNAERKCDFDEWFMDNYYNNEFEPVFEKIEEEECCWTCEVKDATHKTFRDTLKKYELTCDDCHRKEYPEEYEEVEDKNLPELSCCRCFKEIKRDSEEHDETHINENQELICPDCMNGCDCESCLNEEDEDSISFHIPDINKIIMEGAFCRLCDNTLPPHTVARHLDKSDIIHTCPHSASQLLATEIRKEGK
tara:strand:+ start:514 stop:1257 length:744 start_codon:yes stop_codon:yes gene_type:complete